jgi:hypothetical protein
MISVAYKAKGTITTEAFLKVQYIIVFLCAMMLFEIFGLFLLGVKFLLIL